MEEKNQYRNIAKSTSIFGGTQVLQIMVTIVRGKFVALLIGVTGMGINAVLGSIVNMVVQIFTLGLNLSAVREVTMANETGDNEKLAKTVKIFKRWMLVCAIAGAVVTAALSPYISQISFDSRDYTWWVAALGVVIFFTMYGNANLVLMQGLRRLKDLAQSTLLGVFLSLFATIPFYYFWNTNGIMPALIVGSIIVYLTNLWFARKVNLPAVHVSAKESIAQGKEMVKLGVVMMVSALLGTLATYLINTFITHYGNIADVGLFSAGTSITNQYVGVIFTAMAVDFFPRLVAVCNDRQVTNTIINQQSEMVVIMVAPLVIIMMLTAPWIIKLLLSADFLSITSFVSILAFGMIIKAASFAVGYLSFAKGDKRLFFYLDGLGNLGVMGFVMLGYILAGLIGVAVAYVVCYILLYAALLIIVRKRYGFVLQREFVMIFLKMLAMAGAVFALTRYVDNIVGYALSSAIMLASVWYAYILLDKRIGIKQLIAKFRKSKDVGNE